MKPPCKGCSGRHAKCHAECAPYQIYAESRNSLIDAKSREFTINQYR